MFGRDELQAIDEPAHELHTMTNTNTYVNDINTNNHILAIFIRTRMKSEVVSVLNVPFDH